MGGGFLVAMLPRNDRRRRTGPSAQGAADWTDKVLYGGIHEVAYDQRSDEAIRTRLQECRTAIRNRAASIGGNIGTLIQA